MAGRISIVTNYPLDPIHPRTEMIFSLLKSMGYEVNIHNPFLKRTSFQNLLLKLTLGYFDLAGAARVRSKIGGDDLVIIQGLIYLPLSGYARRKNIPVIYETLDNNVHLFYYYLSRKYPILKRITFILRFLEKLEKRYVRKNVKMTIVNSGALKKYFNDQAELIYYSSPLESISNQPHEEAALLYLGSFEKMKGAMEILDFTGNFRLPLLIAGTIYEPDILSTVNRLPDIRYVERISSDRLKALLKEYTGKYYLLGMSMTRGVNLSNKTQELNKDIDYLAMGIPIIGNDRQPTAEKIEAGCGIYFNDTVKIKEILKNKEKRKELSVNCTGYYNRNYSRKIFAEKFSRIINALTT